MQIMRSIDGQALPPGSCCIALGFFDGLHIGHRQVIEAAAAAANAEQLSCCVFTFAFDHHYPEGKAGAQLLLSADIRDRLLEDWGVTHLCCPNFSVIRDLSPEAFVQAVLCQKLGTKRLFCGENYRFGKKAQADVDALRQFGGQYGFTVEVLPLMQSGGAAVSSSRIRALVAEGDMPAAHALLGRPYAIDFEVIHGMRLARKLGAPTINQAMPEGFVVPRFGVYATVATVAGKRYPAVTNVGVKPTVGKDCGVLAETYIMDYAGDLYGKHVFVEFYQFIRSEQRFADIHSLCEQIRRDAKVAEQLAKTPACLTYR